ncbi:unnamed protein product [Caenorhabditis auriculariae]|uniref:Receptor L-domain domain-containing protein n=1 Tax=Caenorhabditis auriculariae TaxID=2777116 RepID=A0A8S1GWQ4_9PELO|nr:unnamed protein product [Caenorhabditis auriculariae]
MEDMKFLAADLYVWNSACESFDGELHLTDFITPIDFRNLTIIHGSLVISSTNLYKLPTFRNLQRINTKGGRLGLVITNNPLLMDISGIANLSYVVSSESRIFLLQNNPSLDPTLQPEWTFQKDYFISMVTRSPSISEDEIQHMTLSIGLVTLSVLLLTFATVYSSGMDLLYTIRKATSKKRK